MPPAFVLQIFHADFIQSNMLQWESSFLLPLYFNPVHTHPELFPSAHKVISKRFFLFNMRGTSSWLLVVPTAAVWQSHSRDGVEWVVEARKQGGAQEFWTGCEGAEQHSRRLGDSLQVSSKWSGGWDQTKPARATAAEDDDLIVQKGLAGTHHLHNATHPIQLWSWPQIFVPLSFTHGPLFFPLKLALSQALPLMWLHYIFMFPGSEIHAIWFHSLCSQGTKHQNVLCTCHVSRWGTGNIFQF